VTRSNIYLRGLLRFWWVLLLGLIIASAVAVLAVYSVELKAPPTLTERSTPTYTAGARILVTTRQKPYYRTGVDVAPATPSLGTGDSSTSAANGEERADFGTLITAANLYPLLIESDQVARLRRGLFGYIPGVVSAQAVYAVNTPGRFVPSRVPVIQIVAAAKTRQNAARLAQGTVDAFTKFIAREQDAGNVKPSDRVIIQQIQAPLAVVSSGGTSFSMPLLAFIAVALAFGGLAVLLDRLFPPTPTRADVVLESVEPRATASGTR